VLGLTRIFSAGVVAHGTLEMKDRASLETFLLLLGQMPIVCGSSFSSSLNQVQLYSAREDFAHQLRWHVPPPSLKVGFVPVTVCLC
jgi:hypothetical protein